VVDSNRQQQQQDEVKQQLQQLQPQRQQQPFVNKVSKAAADESISSSSVSSSSSSSTPPSSPHPQPQPWSPLAKLWNSEYGDGDGSGVTMAANLHSDFNQLHPSAWVYWQVKKKEVEGFFYGWCSGR
jgi:hypothetical protein